MTCSRNNLCEECKSFRDSNWMLMRGVILERLPFSQRASQIKNGLIQEELVRQFEMPIIDALISFNRHSVLEEVKTKGYWKEGEKTYIIQVNDYPHDEKCEGTMCWCGNRDKKRMEFLNKKKEEVESIKKDFEKANSEMEARLRYILDNLR